ncbi:MAG: hypothetical protein RMI91_12995 [Gemmatales bacterium]|nr:hypothetical protein [Gemmatales bacterium]MDW7995560.1 hypothetical protein [Gemmatales bacterium]
MRCTIGACIWLTLIVSAGLLSAEVRGFKVTTDKTIDASSLESIVAQVIERSGAKTNDEKAIALFNWLHQTIFHAANPTEPRPQTVGPLKIIHAYGWGLCGSQHTVLKALYETAGWKCRYVGWSDPPHTTIEVFYDGRWHYFDVFLKCYFWSKDKTYIVSQEEIAADPSLVFDAVKEGRAAPQHLCCGDTEQAVVSGCRSRQVVGDVKGWGSCTWRDQNYSPFLSLPSGASLRLDWRGEPDAFAWKAIVHTCGIKDFVRDPVLGSLAEHYGPRGYSSGTFTYAPNFAEPADLADITFTNAVARDGQLIAQTDKASAIFKVSLPYPYVRGEVHVVHEPGPAHLFVSNDAGKTWKPVIGSDITAAIRQRYDVWLKVEFAGMLRSFRMHALVQHNRYALPYLLPGKNIVEVSLADGQLRPDQVLVVTYAYQEAFATQPRQRFDGKGVTYGPVKTVTRVIESVPSSFVIEVGGNTPPKMLFLERSVRAKASLAR